MQQMYKTVWLRPATCDSSLLCQDISRIVAGSADMLDLVVSPHSLAQIPGDGPVKHFHHDPKQAPGQCRVPTSLGRIVSDERVLGLNLVQLCVTDISLVLVVSLALS